VLGLCAQAGLVGIEVLAIDGTKIHANASQQANVDYEQLANEVLEEAAEIDAAEDEQFGDRRGDELPPELTTSQGRRGWLREAKRRLEDQRAQEAKPIPASRPERVKEAKRRLRGGALDRVPGQRGLRGLSRPRPDEGRAAVRPSA
jgi:hypothetical protein